MIEHHFDTTTAILHVRPTSSLEKKDFEELAQEVDPFIEGQGDLSGLIVEISGFPGWDSFAAMVSHLKFVREHHRHIKRVAVVTDSALGGPAEHLVSHFVSAELKQFPAGDLDAAKTWILAKQANGA